MLYLNNTEILLVPVSAKLLDECNYPQLVLLTKYDLIHDSIFTNMSLNI